MAAYGNAAVLRFLLDPVCDRFISLTAPSPPHWLILGFIRRMDLLHDYSFLFLFEIKIAP